MSRKDRRGTKDASPNPAVAQAFAEGFQQHQAGQLFDAQQLYYHALALDPDHVDTLHYLGVLRHQMGESEQALALIGQAIMLDPRNAECHHNIGLIFGGLGRTDEAIEHYRQAITLKPDYADAHTNLAAELVTKGQTGDGVTHFRRALARKPNVPESYGNLAGALIADGAPDEALAVIARGLEVRQTPQFKELLVDCLRVLRTAPKASELRRWLGHAAFVATARAALLDLAGAADMAEPPPTALEFCCALASQCFASNYAHPAPAAETESAQALRDSIAAAARSGESIAPLALVATAAYASLHSLDNAAALLERRWPDAVRDLLAQQIGQPVSS
jgi:tetratricopeptide (TPR) repeat protein